MKTFIYPGSFDPITLGHVDIIERASKITDKLIVAILINSEKKSLFSIDEKIEMIKESTKHIDNIEICYFDGLLVDFAKKKNADTIVRGLRAVTDFEYELQMAQTNRKLYDKIDTIFLLTNLEYSYLSSSVVKQVAEMKGEISDFVTPFVKEKVLLKYRK